MKTGLNSYEKYDKRAFINPEIIVGGITVLGHTAYNYCMVVVRSKQYTIECKLPTR